MIRIANCDDEPFMIDDINTKIIRSTSVAACGQQDT